MQGRPLLVLTVLLVALAAGCVQGAPMEEVPTGTTDPVSPANEGRPPSPHPSPDSRPATPAPPAPPAAADEPTGTVEPPAPWPDGQGTHLRALVEQAIAAGGPVEVPARPVEQLAGIDIGFGEAASYPVVLARSHILAPDAWAEVDAQRVPFPLVAAYEGHVEGEPDHLVRLTIAPAWARGSIRFGNDVHLVRVGFQGNMPESGASAMTMTTSTGFANRAPPEFFDGADYREEDCLRPVPPFVTPVVEVDRSTLAPLTARLVLDGDAALAQKLGPHAFPMMLAMAHEMDSTFDHEVGLRFQVVGLHLNTQQEYYPDPEKNAPLDRMATYWNARSHVDRDVVHLFTGQESSYAQANCIGGAGHPEVAYTFTSIAWERDYPVFHTNAFAHEMGHIFSAHHHYGNHAESELATLMVQGYTPGMRPNFSTMSKSVIRGWAQSEL